MAHGVDADHPEGVDFLVDRHGRETGGQRRAGTSGNQNAYDQGRELAGDRKRDAHVGERLRAELGIDYVFANTLAIDAGVMTGEVVGEIVDAQRKAQLLADIAAREGISAQQTIAIGDGANDLPMLNAAGLGVAYHAKPVVKETASHAISEFGLDSVLYLMGFSDRDIEEALQG